MVPAEMDEHLRPPGGARQVQEAGHSHGGSRRSTVLGRGEGQVLLGFEGSIEETYMMER